MRIYDSASDPMDFCRRCTPTEAEAILKYGDCGNGPDGRGNCFGYDDEHPDYDEDDSMECHVCKRKLTARD